VIIIVVVRKTSGNILSLSVKNLSMCAMSVTSIFMTISFSPITRFASITSLNSEIPFRKSRSEPDFTVTRTYANKVNSPGYL